jgi:hypothetical protein
MNTWSSQCLALLVVPLMVACGGGSTGGNTVAASATTTPGTLVFATPGRNVSLSAAAFAASLDASPTGQQLHALAAGGSAATPLKCGIDAYKIEFNTVGGAATPEAVRSSGALYVPTGTGCTGPRPIVLYAHGTTTDKAYDISQLATPNPANSEAALIAAIYASNGFIVVAPNYAGYDDSTLSYHPYLNAKQESHEMQDALAAARSALPKLISPAVDAGILFVSGYSQGGHVAMATVRDLEAAGQSVSGSVPMSGPYAMSAFGDVIFSGNVDVGAVVFIPLLSKSYQEEFGNLYTATTDLYTPQYAAGIDTLLPSTTDINTLFSTGKLPPSALFNSAFGPQNPNPALGNFGFGTSFLVTDAARGAYLTDAGTNVDQALAGTGVFPPATPASPIRQALRANDLRMPANGQMGLWLPKSPMLLCAGGDDSTVFSVNTKIIKTYFHVGQLSLPSGSGSEAAVLNIDPSSTLLSSDPGIDSLFAALRGAFQQTQAAAVAANPTDAFLNYHETVAPFCTAASAAYFKSLLPI